MIKKIVMIFVLIIIFFTLVFIFIPKPKAVELTQISPELQNLNSIPVTAEANVPQQSTTSKSVSTQNCNELAKDFISQHGYEKSGLIFYYDLKSNSKIGCLLDVQLSTKWKNGMPSQSFYFNLFNLSDNTTISSYKGTGDGHTPMKEEPETTECKIYGTKEYDCKTFKEYITFTSRILAQ